MKVQNFNSISEKLFPSRGWLAFYIFVLPNNIPRVFKVETEFKIFNPLQNSTPTNFNSKKLNEKFYEDILTL